MYSSYEFTHHAKERSTARDIPPLITDIIVEFGESRDAGDGAKKHTLTKQSMSEIRRAGGRELAKTIEFYRSRNAYVVVSGSKIITVAYAKRQLFN